MKKLIFILFLIPAVLSAQDTESSLDTIFWGTVADDGTGDNLRTGAQKINANDKLMAGAIDDIQTDTADAGDIFFQKADTIPQLVWVIGHALTGDTINFEDNTLVGSIKWPETSDTIVATSIDGVMQGASVDSIKCMIAWHATLLSGSATEMRSTDFKITSTTTGTAFTSGFDNTEIPPGVRIWLIITDVVTGAKPTYFEMTLNGYQK